MAPMIDRTPQFHLRDYIKVLRKHRWLVLGIFFVSVLLTAIWTFVQTPQYQATATVMIDPESPKVLNIQEVSAVGATGPDYYLTQYEIIQSRTVLDRVGQMLSLKQRSNGGDSYKSLRAHLTVEPKRNTRLVFVKYTDPSPQAAAEIANAIAN